MVKEREVHRREHISQEVLGWGNTVDGKVVEHRIERECSTGLAEKKENESIGMHSAAAKRATKTNIADIATVTPIGYS